MTSSGPRGGGSAGAPPVPEAALRKRFRILLVEDNPADVTLVREAFRESRHDVALLVARDGEEAVRMLLDPGPREGVPWPDLVLLDLHLPLLSGHEVLKRLRAERRTRLVPVIVLSGSGAEEDVGRAYAEGANAYLVKPSSFDQLSALAEAIEAYWFDHAVLPPPPRPLSQRVTEEAEGPRPGGAR